MRKFWMVAIFCLAATGAAGAPLPPNLFRTPYLVRGTVTLSDGKYPFLLGHYGSRWRFEHGPSFLTIADYGNGYETFVDSELGAFNTVPIQGGGNVLVDVIYWFTGGLYQDEISKDGRLLHATYAGTCHALGIQGTRWNFHKDEWDGKTFWGESLCLSPDGIPLYTAKAGGRISWKIEEILQPPPTEAWVRFSLENSRFYPKLYFRYVP